MANYNARIRTNYFHVTDEEKYQELFSRLDSEQGIEDLTKTDPDGRLSHGFGAFGCIEYRGEESEIEEFIIELQKILPEDEAFIMMEVGHEKLNYLVGDIRAATRDKTEYLCLTDIATEMARDMLYDNKYTPRLEY